MRWTGIGMGNRSIQPRPILRCTGWALIALVGCVLPARGQQADNQIAATVNGEPIYEKALQRHMDRVPATHREQVRAKRLELLTQDLLIEQYLNQAGVQVNPQEVEEKFNELREMYKKNKKDFDAMLKAAQLTEKEIRYNITAELRWQAYSTKHVNDKELEKFFNAYKGLFDGRQVHVRHILLKPGKDAASAQQAQAQLQAIKKQIESKVAEGLSKLPASTDKLARAQKQALLTEEAFMAQAREKSTCPTRTRGGDVGWIRLMLEPFSQTAFRLKPYQISEVLSTPFGHHLLLVVGTRPGREITFAQAKPVVREVYLEQMRKNLAKQLRKRAKIEIKSRASK